MEPDFWHARWQSETIGFHQSEINRYLRKYINELELDSGDTIFVPLCGKSLDMWWLYEQGFKVIGIELSDIAANSFFAEAGKKAVKTQRGNFNSWAFSDVEILCGDYFDLDPNILGKVDAVFDRAALIALPGKIRKKYIAQLGSLLPVGAHGLLVTLEYPQEEMTGPPFSVSEHEVKELYASEFDLEFIDGHDVIDENSHFRDRGLTSLFEKIYRFQKK